MEGNAQISTDVLASYAARQMNSEGGRRFEGTPPAALALSMEARHTPDASRRDALKAQIDRAIAADWARTLEYTDPNDDAITAIDSGAVPDPSKRKRLPKDEVISRHRQSLEVLKNVFHVLQEGADAPAVLDDRKPAHLAIVHDAHGFGDVVLRSHDEDRPGHGRADERRVRVHRLGPR